jgi:hypothetical protein
VPGAALVNGPMSGYARWTMRGRIDRRSFGTVMDRRRKGKEFAMTRLRNALLAVTLAIGATGCSHFHDVAHWSIFHCSECDDFPTPSYGPGYTMAPGTYTGPPPQSQPSSTGTIAPPSSNVPAQNVEAVVPPPNERPTTPAAATPPSTSTTTPPVPPTAGTP